MAVSVISLLMSKKIAKWTMRVQIIDKPRNSAEEWLFDTIERRAKDAGIGMPEVGIFEARQANAMATGDNRNNALVVVSSGMLQRSAKAEIAAVLAHEVGHAATGDMLTLAPHAWLIHRRV